MVHGQYIGVTQGGDTGWTLEPYKQPRLNVLVGQRFPTKDALLMAIDETLGADVITEMEVRAAARRQQEARALEDAKQRAQARSFVGEKFDGHRPLKDVAKAIYSDLMAAMVRGVIPPDRYRVTVRQQRYDPRIYVYAWAADEIRQTVEQMTHAYNRCQGEPFQSDRWHFCLFVEWPNPWKSRPKAQQGSCEEYEAACGEARAEAEVWGRAYIDKHRKE